MPTPCPCETCTSAYDCDACLDLHMRRDHGTTYAAAFGATPHAWIGVCATHTAMPAQRFGAVEQTTPTPRLGEVTET